MISRFAALAAAVAAMLVLPALALAGPIVYAGPNLQAPPPGVTRQADALFFDPKVATVHVGDSVTWQFRGLHTITFPGSYRQYPFVMPQKAKQPAAKDAAGTPLWWGGAARRCSPSARCRSSRRAALRSAARPRCGARD